MLLRQVLVGAWKGRMPRQPRKGAGGQHDRIMHGLGERFADGHPKKIPGKGLCCPTGRARPETRMGGRAARTRWIRTGRSVRPRSRRSARAKRGGKKGKAQEVGGGRSAGTGSDRGEGGGREGKVEIKEETKGENERLEMCTAVTREEGKGQKAEQKREEKGTGEGGWGDERTEAAGGGGEPDPED